MVLTQDGLFEFIKNMDGAKSIDGRTYEIYDGLSDIIDGDRITTDYDYERVALDIMDVYGTLEEDDYAPCMTIADIEKELGHKFILI